MDELHARTTTRLWMGAALVVCALAGAGCGAKLTGEYDGEATLSLGPGHPITELFGGKTFPVHVIVGPSSIEVQGAPLVMCAPKVVDVSRGKMAIDFSGGVCKVTNAGRTEVIVDGGGFVTGDGETIELTYNGQDLLSVKAKRKP